MQRSAEAGRKPTNGLAKVRHALSFGTIGAVYVWLLLILLFSLWIPELFLRTQTATNILNQYSVTAIVALSIVIPLATGAFDLSIGATMGLSGVSVAWLLGNTGLPVPAVVLIGVGIGVFVGLLNSLVVVAMKIDSFIGTLATGSIIAAITLGVSGNQILTEGITDSFTSMATGSFAGIQLPVVYMFVLMFIVGFFLEQTAVGRKFYATGYNSEVTRLVGVNVNRVRVVALLCSGTIAAFAGVVLCARIQAAEPSGGPSYMIPAFSAAFLGATQFRHGRFNPWGTVVAVLMLGTGSIGLLLAGAPSWAPQVFSGVVLIAAVGVTVIQRRPKVAAAEELTTEVVPVRQ